MKASRSSGIASARATALGMEAPAPSGQACRSGRLIFKKRHHRARRARAHTSIGRSSSYASVVFLKVADIDSRRRW